MDLGELLSSDVLHSLHMLQKAARTFSCFGEAPPAVWDLMTTGKLSTFYLEDRPFGVCAVLF